MHTHFASATHIGATFAGVLLAGTLWRVIAAHGLRSKSQLVAGLSRAMMVQY